MLVKSALMRMVLWVALCSCAAARGEPMVLSSIKPLDALVEELLGEVFDAQVLVPAGASLHEYALRFSDRRRVAAADLVVQVGADLEIYFSRNPDLLSGKRVLVVDALPGVVRLAMQIDEHANHEHDHDGLIDPHLWLSLRNMAILADALYDYGIKTMPEKRVVLDTRYQAWLKRRDMLQARQQTLAQALSQLELFTVHDAYRYLFNELALSPTGTLAGGAEQVAGLRTVARVREQMANSAQACVVSVDKQGEKLLDSLLDDSPIARVNLDARGVELTEGSFYSEYYGRLLDGLERCL